MSTVNGGPNLGETYYQYIKRILGDSGYYSYPKSTELKSTLDSIKLNPSLVIPSNGGKVNTVYSAIPNNSTGDLSVVRNTTATYVGKDGLIKTAVANEPRFEFEPITGNYKGLLVEPQRTNLATYSQDFTQAIWSKGSATITSTTRTSPDGTPTATELDDTDASSIPSVPSRAITSTSTSVNYSIYTKNVSSTLRRFLLRNNTTLTNFDVLTFNYSSTGDLGSGWFSENMGNGWFRLSYTRTTGISVGDSLSIYYGRTGAAAVGATDKWQIWGGQLENGGTLTSYIPTVASTVTRNADVISKSGISSLIGQTEGTIFVEATLQGQSLSDSISKVLCDMSLDSSLQNRITIYRFNNIIYYDNVVGGAVQFAGPVFTITNFTGKIKIALTYQLNNVKVFINGSLVNTDTTALVPTCNTFRLGGFPNSLFYNGSILNSALFPTVLTDSQALQLTTLQ